MTVFSGKPEIAVGQVTNVDGTSNSGDDYIVNSLADVQAETVDDSNAFTITNVDPTWLWESNITWIFSDAGTAPTAQITLNVPASPVRGMFNVINDTSQTILVQVTGGGGASITIAAGAGATLCNDGTDIKVIARS